jgi:hypothetical protein
MKPAARTAAALTGTALALYPLTIVRMTHVTGLFAIAALTLLGIASWTGWWAFAGAGAGAFVLEYAAALLSRPGHIDVIAPVVGLMLLVLVELVDLVGATTPRVYISNAVFRARGAFLLGALVAGGTAAGAALIAGLVVRGQHVVLLTVGAACALGALAIAAVLSGRALTDG